MALAKTYAFIMPTLSERVTGLQKLIDAELEVLRLKKDHSEVYLRMKIYDNPDGFPDLEKTLRKAYESAGWRVGFGKCCEGIEIILSE